MAIIILILVSVVYSISPRFLSPFNIFTLTRNLAIDTVIGFAMMVVLACGHMNLAVGSIGVSVIMTTGLLLEGVGLPIPLAIVGGLLVGALLGWVNGMLTVKTGIHSFVITLATASLFFGAMLILTKAEAYRELPAAFNALGKARFGYYSALLVVTGVVAAGLFILFKFFDHRPADSGRRSQPGCGRDVRRPGGPGHRHRPHLSGLIAGIAGVMVTARLAAALPSVGADWLLPSSWLHSSAEPCLSEDSSR